MRANDDWVLVLRSTASEAVTRGNTRVRVELAHVKGLVAALAEAAADPVALPTTGGGIMGKLQLSVNHPAASCGALSAGRISLGAAAPKPPLAIPPRSKLGGILVNRVKSYVLRCRSIQGMTRPA